MIISRTIGAGIGRRWLILTTASKLAGKKQCFGLYVTRPLWGTPRVGRSAFGAM